MTWVFDATPLIVFAKADRLDVVDVLDDERVIPTAVYEEVVETGVAEGYPDARRVKRAVEADTFSVVDAPDSTLYEELAASHPLSAADAAVLALARGRDGIAVMDERAGRGVADAEGIETRGTAYVVLTGVKRGELSPSTARTVLDEVVDAGWHCSTDLYARILRKLDELS